MKILFFLLGGIPSVLFASEEIPNLLSEYRPSHWPEARLRLSQAGTLKDLFDSGLRPYRFPSLETSTLEVKHLRLAIELASGKILPEIPAEWMNIAMFDDGEIAHLEGATSALDLKEAKSQMEKWLLYAKRSEVDLNHFLGVVKADPLGFDDPYGPNRDGFAVLWEEPGYKSSRGGPGCSVWFRKSFDESRPLKLNFKLSWNLNRSSKDARFYRVPIPPPPGYEHISMDAPKGFGPDSSVNVEKSRNESFSLPNHVPDAGGRNGLSTNRKSPDSSPRLFIEEESRRIFYGWVASAIFLILIAVRYWWVKFRKFR